MVHLHPVTKRNSVWLHLGMTGAVIMKDPKENLFELLDPDELKILCNQYNDLLNAGFENGYSINYEYDTNDCLFIDNLAVAHRAAPEAHLPAGKQGLRIMHRSTVQAVNSLKPDFGLPIQLDIYSRVRSEREYGSLEESDSDGTTKHPCKINLLIAELDAS